MADRKALMLRSPRERASRSTHGSASQCYSSAGSAQSAREVGMVQDNDRQDAGAFDYIIVGAGASGCCLANRLSAYPDVNVRLQEPVGKANRCVSEVPSSEE